MRQGTELGEAAGGAAVGKQRAAGGLRLADQAYLRLRDDIITVRLRPGDPLDEKTLSRQLGLGLTPVRDALKRLTLERLAIIYPRRGTFVTDINISDERWLTEVRIEMEGLAAALAAERATDEECAALTALASTLEDSSDLSMDYISVDTEIHRAIYAAAHNPYLEVSLNQYANLALRIWHYGIQRMRARTPRSCSQDEVVAAICARKPEAARKAAQGHLLGFSAEVRALL
ncbi:GntR family transcriptional regulator [Streptomyces sp. NPDC046862]|uniref:GntR family transcriptional regulator n=1 Tax=Streptomyces sp. NPDC046862 TaxID=3154603 RepID=UPI0034548222